MKHKIFSLLLGFFINSSLVFADVTPVVTPIATPVKPAKLVRLPQLKFFTDKKDSEYTHPYPQDESKCAILFKNKKRWADLRLKGAEKSGVYMGVGENNLAPYLEKGALQFYIRGNKGDETLTGVGFTMATDSKHKYHFATTVPLGDYCGVTTKWQMVTIPLSEFPLTGKHIERDEHAYQLQKATNQQISNSTDQVYQTRFNWSRVIELELENNRSSDTEMEIQISNVVILPEYKLKTVLREKEAMQ
jgi:hypothetical protein